MGAGASREELVYMAVQRLDLAGIRALRQQGANLEWHDAKGRTPLMLACSRPESFEAAYTLLQLGADVRAYAKGAEGGTPIHFAARRKLTRTVEMLINYGADPLQRNDSGRTALDLSREQHNTPMVRLIEGRLALFQGQLRQHVLSNSLLKMLVPQWVSRIVWVVVLPVAKGSSSLQLIIYPTADAPMPSSWLLLQEQLITMTKQDTSDPKCVVHNNRTGEKLKFGSEPPDRPQQVFQFYNACHGINPSAQQPSAQQPSAQQASAQQASAQQASAQQASAQQPSAQQPAPAAGYALQPLYGHPPAPAATTSQPFPYSAAPAAAGGAVAAGAAAGVAKGEKAAAGKPMSSPGSSKMSSFQSNDLDDDAALKLALEESMRTASASRPGAGGAEDFGGWGAPAPSTGPPPAYGGWGDEGAPVSAPGAGPPGAAATAVNTAPSLRPVAPGRPGGSAPVGPATPSPAAAPAPAAVSAPLAPPSAPSAPPLEPGALYPVIDMTPVVIDYDACDPTPPPAPVVEAPVVMNSAYSEDRVKAELKKAEDSKGGGQCVICWDAPAQAVCIPCGHIAGCMECLTEVKDKEWGCPVCRTKIENIVKVYHV